MIRDQKIWVSGYRTMWMMVMFDLPVTEKKARRAASRFRLYLQNEGFGMAQFSVYYRFMASKEIAEAVSDRIMQNLPPEGHVEIIMITDKQYENIKSFHGKKKDPAKKHEQLTLF